MGPPRRGGPFGRCHSWLELSKRHKQLRKLIPIYFPGNFATFFQNHPKNLDGNIGAGTVSSSSVSVPTEPSCGVDSHGHCSSMAKAPAAPDRIPKLSLTWNIDEPETSRLHGMMNASLIFKSLNMSPIHWKCVPQLCGLRGKHCASICGVIIRRKRKGAKRICDAPANSNDNECKSPTGSDLNEPLCVGPLKEINTPQLDSSELSDCPSPRERSGVNLRKGLNKILTKQEELPVHEITNSSSAITKSPPSLTIEKENVHVGTFSEQDASLVKPEPYASIEPVSASLVCRFCSRSLNTEEKRPRKQCGPCTSLIQKFIQTVNRIEDLTCSREIPCSVRWPVHWVPSNDLLLENTEKRLLQQHGPFAEEWCVPCKVAHCVKMGCRLTDFCAKRASKRSFLKSISSDMLSDPEFQHRGRERFVKQCLRSLAEDFGELDGSVAVISTGGYDPCEHQKVSVAKFLDSIWVRPVYLPSRSQLCSPAFATQSLCSVIQNTSPISSASFAHENFVTLLEQTNERSSVAVSARDTLPDVPATDVSKASVQNATCCLCSHLSPPVGNGSASTLENIKSRLSRLLVQSSVYEITVGPARVHSRTRIRAPVPVCHGSSVIQNSDSIPREPHVTPSTPSDFADLDRVCGSSSSTAQRTDEPHPTSIAAFHTSPTQSPASGLHCSARDSPFSWSSSKRPNPEMSVSICGPCLRHIRLSIQQLMQSYGLEYFDPLSKLIDEPHSFCRALNSGQSQNELMPQSCLQRSGDPPCDHCHLYKCLTFLCDRLHPKGVCDPTCIPPEPGLCEHSEITFLSPIGGPLILPLRPVDEQKTDTLFARWIPPKVVSAPSDESVLNTSPCICCCFRSNSLSHYRIGSSDQLVCSGCLWTYKEGIISVSVDKNVKRVAKRLASAAAATDSAVPLLSATSQRTLIATARLAQLFSAPCTPECSTNPSNTPLWITCPACTRRRCHRLLPISLPLHPPRWYRLRIKLLQRLKLLEDLDPRLMWCQSKPTDLTAQANTTKVTSHHLALVDIEYTTSVIERWLMPPEPPTSYLTSVDSAEPMSEYGPPSSSLGSDEESEDNAISDISSESSIGVCSPVLSDHESEYGGSSWWDVEVSPPEELIKTTSVADDSSATEPEMDEAAAEAVTVASVTMKRQRKPSLRAVEADVRNANRKGARCLGKLVSPIEEQDSETSQRFHPSTVCESSAISSSDPPVTMDPATREDLPTMIIDAVSNEDRISEESELNAQPPEDHPERKLEVSLTRTESTAHPIRRKSEFSPKLIIRGKRRLKLNHRFLDDFHGDFPFLSGHGRQLQRIPRGSSDSDVSTFSYSSESRASTRKTLNSNRASLMAQKRAHARLNKRSRLTVEGQPVEPGSVPGGPKSTMAGTLDESETDEVSSHSSMCSSNLGPRVKQISRPALNLDSNRYTSALSAMVHAARLAAVGAKIPGGTSPTHAALAATAYSTSVEPDDRRSSESDTEPPSRLSQQKLVSSLGAVPSASAQCLPERCGQCPACCGLVQPCGTCSNCWSLQKSDKHTSNSKAQPCKELICFRRRNTKPGSKSGPRVKLPTNFPSPNTHTSPARSLCRANSGAIGATSSPSANRIDNFSFTGRDGSRRSFVSLFDTVPGLSKQIELDAWLAPSDQTDNTTQNVNRRGFFRAPRRTNSTEVFATKPPTPIPGGDLGMRFAPPDHSEDFDGDLDQIRPAEGEVVTSDLAHYGGYAVVTTIASAPPKEICYACGSGGGQLLFCASCAEPFHFYCVERQFRPRRKDHFICRNCTQCRQCRRSAADLRCVRCSGGYHPTCLPSYAPAQSSQRGNWVCPHCTSCVHCGAKPLKKSLDSSDDTESTVLWSPDCSKCAACGLAEARGDVCPECDRAYLPTAKQMIQCDTCQLWMHRTCTKLTTDEYEWIARLPAGRLNKYIVNCTVCQNEQNQRMAATSNSVDSGESSAKTDNLNGAERLRSLAKDTLMDRMATLVASCRRATASSDSINQLAQTHDSPEFSKVSSRVQSALTFSLDNYKTGSLDRPAFPQVDGNFDEDSEAESVHGARQESSTDASMLPGCASDILLYEDANPLPIPSRLISISPDSCSNAPVLRRTEMRDRHRRTSGGRSERPKVCMSSVRPLSSLGPPPTTAYWLTESETAEIWTSPRILLYRVLTRVIHRLSAHPIDSLYAVVLRRMLKWLSAATEYLFPWLDITEMANDVRDVLRQAKGEFAAVWRHFENCALLELHELLCPVIARTTGRLLYSQSLLFPSSARPWADMAAVDQCISTVSQHIKAHHHSDVLIPPDDTPRKLSEFKHIIALKDLLMQCPSSQCHRPHELEMLEKMKTESREERWVEHWSATEEKMVLRNFQRCLLRQSQRLAASSIQQRKTQPSNFGENCSEHSVFTHPSGITTMDDTSHSERTAIANDHCDNKVKNEPVITFKSQSLMSAKFQPGEVDVKELRRSAPQFFKHPAQFYFADCDFWASMPDVAPPTNCTKEPPVDLDEDPEPRSALDFTSDEEDVRPCLLCGHHGDNGIEGRLLFTGADTWVHVNCALWSNEVYEEDTGQLIGLSDALRRGRKSLCIDCGRYGATMMCSNSHEPGCTLFNPSWSHRTECNPPLSPIIDSRKAIHFACALRRRPPATRPVFTVDRSWFCSPECHRVSVRRRIADAIHASSSSKDAWCADHSLDDMSPDATPSRNQNLVLARSVVDDMEPISLGELLVCRRVFVPSNCFVASLYPPGCKNSAQLCYTDLCDSPEILQAAYEAISNLSTSPNSLAFLRCTGLPASLLVVTVGSLRVDRLGEVREASDSFAYRKSEFGSHSKRSNYLCPINYRARRIYWSCHKLDDRVSYTLHVKQMHAITNLVVPTPPTTATLLTSCVPPYTVSSPAGPRSVPCSQHSFQSKQITTWASIPVSNIHPVISVSRSATRENSNVVDSRWFYLKPTVLRLTPIPPTDRTITNVTTTTGCLHLINASCYSVKSSPLVQTVTPSIAKTSLSTTPAATSPPTEPDLKTRISTSAVPVRIVNTMSFSSGDISPTHTQSSRHGTQPPTHRLPVQRTQSSFGIHFVNTSSISPRHQSKLYAYELNSLNGHPVSCAFTSNGAQLVRPPVQPPLQPTQLRAALSNRPVQPVSTISQPGGAYSPSIVHSNRTLTTPTKDEQLACQLNGLFKNLPIVQQRSVGHLSNNGQVPYNRQPLSDSLPITAVPVRTPHSVLPQLDGALDDENDGWYVSQSKRSRLVTRDTLPQWRPRSGSSTSTDSSASNRTTLSSVSKRSRLTENVSNTHSKSKKHRYPSQPPSSPKPATARKRWIEDRNKQQELADLVSKAKQANQARLYQNEVEKHARAFRLRFSIDTVVRAAASPGGAWRAVVSRVAALREKQGLPSLISDSVDGWTQFGLNHRHVIFLVEQMRGAFQCYRYRFRYHCRKVDRLRRKFTPPVPVVEGCARAIGWTKPQRPTGHARDPLGFLHCKANPPPRPLLKSSRDTLLDKVDHTTTQNCRFSNGPAALLSPNERKMCVEAARQAASLVAVQLKIPMKMREACVAQAVVQATGLPFNSIEKADDTSKNGEAHSPKTEPLFPQDTVSSNDTPSGTSSDNEESDNSDQEPDLGNVTTQFKRLVSGSAARFLRISVHPSRIHGRGLFALRGFFEDEMVVEYMGELIRNLVCEAREVRYRAASVDCYMFRIDEDLVIDATYAGNAARFINHSCDPNCYAKVITMEDRKHIVILAKRRIYPGEELTYDYRFPKESDKLLCNCGSYNCRKYLN